MWADFKAFAFKGNVLDLAIGVVIGAAFGKIVSSLVDNVIMPVIGGLFGGISFEQLYFNVRGVEVFYGIFIQSVFDFLIIATSIFLFVRLIMKFQRQEEIKEEIEEGLELDPKQELLIEIRDLLKEKRG